MKYYPRPRGEPTDENFLALLILLGPLAFVVRLVWRGLLRENREQHDDHDDAGRDEDQ